MERELEEFDKEDSWNKVFQEIRSESNGYGYACRYSRKAENSKLNRYNDVIPFDHNRIHLGRGDRDYINASLVEVDSADRKYILTQSPLPHTIGHFWLMVWEQKSTGIIMLNRIIERGQIKCAQYWPSGSDNDGQDEFVFENIMLKVEIVSEEKTAHYIVRSFLLTDLISEDSRKVTQFHYTSWPDFGIPESPSVMLDFLFAIRESGTLDLKKSGPPIVHCSAGIGRSGTLCLVDTCLVLIEKLGDVKKVDIRQILLHMRKYRMGLVQTPEQLRFSYVTIIEGARTYVNSNRNVSPSQKLEAKKEFALTNAVSANSDGEIKARTMDGEQEEDEESEKPSLPPRERAASSSTSKIEVRSPTNGTPTSQESREASTRSELPTNNNNDGRELRQRAREERKKRTSDTIKQIREKLKKSEERSRLNRYFIKYGFISLGAIMFLGTGIYFYKYYSFPSPSPNFDKFR